MKVYDLMKNVTDTYSFQTAIWIAKNNMYCSANFDSVIPKIRCKNPEDVILPSGWYYCSEKELFTNQSTNEPMLFSSCVLVETN